MNKPRGSKWRMAAYLAAMLFAWLPAIPAFADGKVFPAKAYPAEVKIPDQSALLIWSNGIERLVIETRFVGEGTNFAWVVPLPSVPEIEPATTGLFPTLRNCLQPAVRHAVPNYWAVALFVCGLFWLVATVRAEEETSGTDLIGCLLTAAGAAFATGFGSGPVVGFLLLFLLLLYVVRRVRGGQESYFAILIVLFVVLLLSSMLLPALGTAGGGSASASGNGVQVLGRKIVGIFETTVITAKDSKALLRWLDGNGFAADRPSEPVVEHHVRDGWVFVAAKVNRDAAQTGAAVPHPLSFTFKASQPVYPLRLTGVGSERLALELFVVGAQRAEIDGFKVTECHQIIKGADAPRFRRQSPIGHFSHRLFNDWVGDLPIITRLEAILTPQNMTSDATISWRTYTKTRTHVYSHQGAVVVAANWSVPPVFILLVALGLLARKGRLLPDAARKYAGLVISLCLLAGIVIYLGLPKVEVRLESFAWLRGESNLKHFAMAVDGRLKANQPVVLETVRQAAIQTRSELDSQQLANHLQGGVIHEEDSPGNYTVRETAQGVDFIGHDAQGGEEVLFTFKNPAGPGTQPVPPGAR